nr:alcohol dehydrogenase catalytic domain-containing protein [Anaerolineae bacterium]
MKAIRIEQLGGSDVMQVVDIPTPEPKPKQVLVKIEAVGLNYSDIMIREGRYLQRTELPQILGREFAGVIEAV